MRLVVLLAVLAAACSPNGATHRVRYDRTVTARDEFVPLDSTVVYSNGQPVLDVTGSLTFEDVDGNSYTLSTWTSIEKVND